MTRNKRTEQLNLNFSPELIEHIRMQSEAHGLTMTSFVERCCWANKMGVVSPNGRIEFVDFVQAAEIRDIREKIDKLTQFVETAIGLMRRVCNAVAIDHYTVTATGINEDDSLP